MIINDCLDALIITLRADSRWQPSCQSTRASSIRINSNKITLLRVIPTMTFQNSLLTPLLSEAFVTGLLPN